ncbi:MAG: IS1634 family transposase [Planctomycetes bacterium]|nr:IS1634 family transposase [Planctomycetota bacterium]
MYIDEVPNRNSRPAILLRESRRQGHKTIKNTLANMTDWPREVVDAIRLVLKGETLVPKEGVFAIERSVPHGHVEAVLGTLRRLGLEDLIASKRCRERDLVVAMVVQRLVAPCSKLATTREWQDTTLGEELGVLDASEDELYAALDWLRARQERIENKLAKRHLREGAVVLYDVTSSTYYGRTCPLAAWGHNRDGTKQPCIAYGLLADREGRPISVDVYEGNTGDPATIPGQVDKLRSRFGLSRVVLVGDRGMLTETQIDPLRERPGLGWISALRSEAIRGLVASGELQLSLFDEQNLAEITSADFPGERLMACYNPLLADDRRRTRTELVDATEKRLTQIAAEVQRRTRTPLKADAIGVKVGKVINHYKVGKHFRLTIADNHFAFERDEAAMAQEAQLDGIYVVRTSEARRVISEQDAVRAYKSLSQVEQAFRCLKGVDLRVRPIHHRTADHVRGHVFLCMLAYYVEWHLRRDLASVLFEDEEVDAARATRDPVAQATPSESAKRKKATHRTSEGWPVHSFQSLMKTLGTRCKNTCRAGNEKTHATFHELTEPTPFQAHILHRLGLSP